MQSNLSKISWAMKEIMKIFKISEFSFSVVMADLISLVRQLTPVQVMVQLWYLGQDWQMKTWNLYSSIPQVSFNPHLHR